MLATELGYGFTDRLNAAVVAEFEREGDDGTELEEISIEAVYRVGTLPGDVDFAVYGEFAAGLQGEDDELEFRALFDKALGPLSGRVNLIAEHSLGDDEEGVELGYAASVDGPVAEGVRLGLQAFGGENDEGELLRGGEHFIGPAVTLEFGGVELEAGYLFTAGSARDKADGQLRFRLARELSF